MKTIVHKADSRGTADYGWLNTHYTFSFANYYNPERIHFGALRVLNDDVIDGGLGFDRHPHDNMEIITIPLEGEIRHKDSMGNTFVVKKNDVQIMSAGTGIFHSEYNNLPDTKLELLQIWVFPEKKNIQPRYDQLTFDPSLRLNQWQRLVSPSEPEAAKIMQQAYFSRVTLESGKSIAYAVHGEKQGIYLFIIAGSVTVGDLKLENRDGVGISGVETLQLEASQDADILLMEIPMMNDSLN